MTREPDISSQAGRRVPGQGAKTDGAERLGEIRGPEEREVPEGQEAPEGRGADEQPLWTEDTIVAISTAIGAGAIGIVRMSGPEAVALAGAVFQPARGRPLELDETYSLLYGHVVDPENGEVVDEALLVVMRRPRSYTREDVVELQCHGGVAAQRAVLRLLVRGGARLAEPGEFTKRAFLNGRIDLTQAESVAAIVAARSSGALRASVRQLDGGLSEKLQAARRGLVRVLARIEATVDFSDEDVEEVDWQSAREELSSARGDLGHLLQTAFLGRALEQGVRTAIVGRPNAGKSSLLNALLMRERAIVSAVPGTTRDTVEELMEIGGVPIHLVDTAGIRTDGDQIEQLGVERSVRAMEQADLILVVVDLAAPGSETEQWLGRGLDPARSIVVGNKIDLVDSAGEALAREALRRVAAIGEGAAAEWDEESVQGAGGRSGTGRAARARAGGGALNESDRSGVCWRACAVSALTGEGLEELRSLIQHVVTGGQEFHLEEPILASERQRVLVGEAYESVGAALSSASEGLGEELVCEDVRAAVVALGRITGEELTPDLLDEIFSRFCLGK